VVGIDNLLKSLLALYTRLRDDNRMRWQRDLPFNELLFNRWERAKNLNFGEGTSIYHNSYVYGDVKVGCNTWIGPYTLLDGSGGLEIGDFCSISTGVQIYTHDSVKWALSGGKAEYEHSPVKIGNCCYIGSGTIIAKGVTIGTRSVIGSGSFVNRDIAPNSVAIGSPCRSIGRVIVDVHGNIKLEYEKGFLE